MDSAQAKELVTQRIRFLLLGKDILQRQGQLTQALRFRPRIMFRDGKMLVSGKQSVTALGALL
ncbi:MAG: hypothetical protein ABSD67_11985 [Terracidiphilus sp.]